VTGVGAGWKGFSRRCRTIRCPTLRASANTGEPCA
jgi:hypothetical protein